MSVHLPMHPDHRARARALRERQHADVQAGLWRGASPVRRLSPEEIAGYERELRERDRPRGPAWTTPMPGAQQPPPESKPEPKEEPVESLERARSLRAELEQIEQQLEEKRREALQIADELEQEAHALREAVGAVPVDVVTQFVNAAAKATREASRKPRVIKGSTLPSRILAALADGKQRGVQEIARELDVARTVVNAACVKLANAGKLQRIRRGTYQITK